MAEAFYLPLGDGVYRSTEHTVGPWNATDQHGGPPAGLLVRALEEVLPVEGHLARVTIDLLTAVPVVDLTVGARVVRPGRTVALAEAELRSDGGTVLARAAGWWHRTGDTVDAATAPDPAPPLPHTADDESAWPGGYLQAMEWRWVSGHFTRIGPGVVWTRMRMPLVPDTEPSPAQRVLVSADSGNGAGGGLSIEEWLYVNTDLTVHLARPAIGEWICLDARTLFGPAGSGTAMTRLLDDAGEFGRGAQALILRRRG